MTDLADVIIEVRGGNVVEVYGQSQKTRVTIIDWDNWEVGDSTASVSSSNCLPISEIPEETINLIESGKTKLVD